MSNENELSQQREALKHLLASNAYPTLVDRLLDGTWRLLQRITRRRTPISLGASALAIQGAIWLLGLVVAAMTKELFPYLDVLVIDALWVFICWSALVTVRLYKTFVFDLLREHILDYISKPADLDDLQSWLCAFSDWKRHLAFSLLVSLPVMAYAQYYLGVMVHLPLIWSRSLTIYAATIQAGIFVYFIFLLLRLSNRLGKYTFDLYPANPSGSEVLGHISRLLNIFAYITTGVITFVTLVFALLKMMVVSNILLLVAAGWGPLVLLFVSNQLALGQIIRRAKWKTLEELQAKIKALHTREETPSKETLEHLRSLIDYHDYIKATPDSALNLRAGLNFLNTLLLPVIALLLANLDKLLALLP